jgi:hypothetical protein
MGQLRQIRDQPRFRVELSFSYPHDQEFIRPSGGEARDFEQVLLGQLVNYTVAREWQGMPAKSLDSGGDLQDLASPTAMIS